MAALSPEAKALAEVQASAITLLHRFLDVLKDAKKQCASDYLVAVTALLCIVHQAAIDKDGPETARAARTIGTQIGAELYRASLAEKRAQGERS